jgi:hypothetical protein
MMKKTLGGSVSCGGLSFKESYSGQSEALSNLSTILLVVPAL